jgi:hypothetical protein
MINRHLQINERGSAMVETSLVILVFFTMTLAILNIGQVLFLQSSVLERVRAGLRYGVVTYDSTAIQNMVLYGTSSPSEGATPSFNLTSSMVTVSRFDAQQVADRVVIQVSNYPMDFYTPFFARRLTASPIKATLPMETGNLPD